ncbi:hypothetical protein EV421DRAFT_659519 [Armillaria borealis]|uniref:Secreted protein n=1 Tax=Armillaria borealis TaxID=47425 RepID=A0AA39N014_9AGAR|nr:hypothetical protein EV421DRAFT_659519 [Armillaria borealis]
MHRIPFPTLAISIIWVVATKKSLALNRSAWGIQNVFLINSKTSHLTNFCKTRMQICHCIFHLSLTRITSAAGQSPGSLGPTDTFCGIMRILLYVIRLGYSP